VKCIILAAGTSSRLRPATDTIPKCLLNVGGQTILQRMIENVLAAGISQIGIVIGYRGEQIREFAIRQFPNVQFRFILNPEYSTTNNAYSLLLAKGFVLAETGDGVKAGFLLLDSDIVFSHRLLPFLRLSHVHDTIAVRVRGDHDDEEVRVCINGEKHITEIGKGLSVARAFGESVGIEIFSHQTALELFHVLDERVRNGSGREEYYEAAFQEMIDKGVRFDAIDVSKFPTMEIDTGKDLEQAQRLADDDRF
jgi:choline kinase